MRKLIVKPPNGLGDCLYTHEIIRYYVSKNLEVLINTKYPELFSNISGVSNLQSNIRNNGINLTSYKKGVVNYNIHSSLVSKSKVDDKYVFKYDLPKYEVKLPKLPSSPICLIRPVTDCKIKHNKNRSTRQEYINHYISKFKALGYTTVLVADINDSEYYPQPPIETDFKFEKGELSPTQLIELVRRTDVCVGGVGWIVPACLFTNTPLLCVLGGQGGFNSPETLEPKGINSSITWAYPDNFCKCKNFYKRRKHQGHKCDNTITNLDMYFEEFLKENEICLPKTIPIINDC